MRRLLTVLTTAILGAVLASPASAAIYDFSLKGLRGDATFEIDTTKGVVASNGLQIDYFNVAGTYNGINQTAEVIFGGSGPLFSPADFQVLGTTLGLNGFEQFAGPVLFTGPVTAPVFTEGTFALPSIVSGPATITISAAVPEPSTWAMMVVGFAGIGALVYRRRQGTPALQIG